MQTRRRSNFLTDIIDADLAAGKNRGLVVTRFPPEPNGFLHIGHAKSILLNFGLAEQYGGRAHLRFDDTNPTTEETLYVESIQEDVRWLGCDWGKHLYYASDYFEQMYECAVRLIREGKAYVDSQPVEAIRGQRGAFERPGTNSPFRDRSADENLDLFRRMRAGELPDGSCVLRAKIDMAHPNVLLRDPLLYRIRHAHHHRTLDRWCIYPMYDYAHPLEDGFEGVTHSICTLEFESNRAMYDWVLDNLGPWDPRPHQYEFARLALGYTVMSKRKLLQLVAEKRVSGWDDPRLPTIAGLRRRGVTKEAIREFAELIGVAKNNSIVDIGKLEFCIRQDLEGRAPRGMAVLNPLKVVLSNWPQDRVEELEIAWWPAEPEKAGLRGVPFGRELFIEREDFSESPPADWKRLAPGREVRLIGAYVVRCAEVVRGPAGEVRELRCTYDASSKGGEPADKRKIPGTLHWVHAGRSAEVEARLYDRLFRVGLPDAEGDFLQHMNPESLVVMKARVEPALAEAAPGTRWQFLRQGYFFVDPVDSRPGAPVFNRVIGLRDTWAKATEQLERKPEKKKPEPKPAAPKKGRAEARAEVRAGNPELASRYARYQSELTLSADEADLLTGDLATAEFFDAAVSRHGNAKLVARWLLNDLLGLAKKGLEGLPLRGEDFGRFVALLDSGRIAPAAGKTLLARLVEQGGDPQRLVNELGLGKVADGAALAEAVGRVLDSHAAEVARYRAGEKKLLGVFIGAVMKEMQGVADAAAVRKALADRLG
ncbi:MAG: glutamine--tRNA ligase/YqeY domain fusion protein [Myxococcales bacterium]|nr:glutamine--tRNA ligase/YqeY domain fusion protein [Myxococcales bacterium]